MHRIVLWSWQLNNLIAQATTNNKNIQLAKMDEQIAVSNYKQAQAIFLPQVGLSSVALGAVIILFDPIFQGLAISLMGGTITSTFLTLLVVPLLYYRMMRSKT